MHYQPFELSNRHAPPNELTYKCDELAAPFSALAWRFENDREAQWRPPERFREF
jgi:hypothetical protein